MRLLKLSVRITNLPLLDYDLDRYLEKLGACHGVDPFELIYEESSSDPALWPKVTVDDRIAYFVYRITFVDSKEMKNYKSLEAHNFFTSGHVFPPVVKVLNDELVLVFSQVSYTCSCSIAYHYILQIIVH